MSSIKLSQEEWWDIDEGTPAPEIVANEDWRWGTNKTYVFPRGDKFYEVTLEYHTTEGNQTHYPLTAYEVEPYEVTVTKYRRVKQDGKLQ